MLNGRSADFINKSRNNSPFKANATFYFYNNHVDKLELILVMAD